ncbi:RNA polymerase sigma factor [Marinilabilia salmonicolor]|uniref:RNA polymerase sigma-70 factor (ECF subfamily) n=1 Tax=Marinilabilia salmonicolor TaxID=989 RepID=A0A2T0XP38_9BACT|nr:sigma-70 family RNA polymerase sigma factor [Marinilabilia salmonicolor]PRZ00642.1 RNA polymerase sigma-70 factor (ECF subfamily) [Marinilabilia salmonicolor]RCW30844.1 RNA polymerase sigma-70 factor (ECF subfamily) [Marinilabilia salmonicolor]
MSGANDIYEIVVACQKGERSAQKALYELFAPKMLGVCMRYASNRETAEDFLQDGFIRVFDNIEKFRFKGSFEGWMRRVIVNMIIESFRKRKIETELTDNFPDGDGEVPGEGIEDQVPSLGELLGLIQQLPERYRMVFNLYVLEERTHEQIAEELGISVGTSKSNLSRARKWLQERLRNAKKMEAAKI